MGTYSDFLYYNDETMNTDNLERKYGHFYNLKDKTLDKISEVI
jgi:hypothetical protein